MPLKSYGVLVARAVGFRREGAVDTPHYQIHLVDDAGRHYRAVVDVLSQESPSELLHLVIEDFWHPVTAELTGLRSGWTNLSGGSGGPVLDFVRGDLIDPALLRPLPLDAASFQNPLADVLDNYVQHAVHDPGARLYVFGQRWGPQFRGKDEVFGFLPADGVHDIHMNQGNSRRFRSDDGVCQDGALLIHFPGEDRWVGFFLAFRSQSWNTDYITGHALDAGAEVLVRDRRRARAPIAGLRLPMVTTDLPEEQPVFVGREAELAGVRSVLDAASGPDPSVRVCVISGPPGSGKTALALHAAHRAVRAGDFPGGTLFVDLQGDSGAEVTSDQAVLALLDALGAPEPDVPADPVARYALYRTLLARRSGRTMVLLDNALDARQVSPLLPGSEEHRVLVTTRSPLAELPARLVQLEPLAEDSAVDLLTDVLRLGDPDDARAREEPRAVRELGSLCGGNPLALCIAAAILRRDPGRGVASLVHELRVVVEAQGTGFRDLIVRAYRALPGEQAGMLRVLTTAPGPETCTEAAAVLSGLPVSRARAALNGLATAAFVAPVRDAEGDDDRWRLHTVVRNNTSRTLAVDASETAEARHRLIRFYAQQVSAAIRALGGSPASSPAGARMLHRLDAERPNLVASAQWAEEERGPGLPPAVGLALSLGEYLLLRGHLQDAIAVGTVALHAARRIGDSAGENRALETLGLAWLRRGDVPEAVTALEKCRDHHHRERNQDGEARAWHNLGIVLVARSDSPPAAI
ncbi:DUF2278 family protein [Streptomyces sp. NPDC046909]|uniref:DUF2278 family protein n=1 Tax=Streptomyces sp. NPDC046909 TaxID=3155617 RepID=UPI0033FDAB51